MEKNKKVIVLSTIAILLLVTTVILVYYVLFTYDKHENLEKSPKKTGKLTIDCAEKTFELKNTKKMSDKDGIKSNENIAICTLKSEMDGAINVGYDLALYDIDIDYPNDSIKEDNVKVQITRKVNNEKETYLGNSSNTKGILIKDLKNIPGEYDKKIDGYKIDSSTISGNHEVVYTIKAWADKEEKGNISYKIKLGDTVVLG